MKVLLLSTRRLAPEYLETIRADLGGGPDLGLDVVGWVAPAVPLDGLVDSFTLIGPGRMPVDEDLAAESADEVEVSADEVPAPAGEAGKAPAPEAVTEDSESSTGTVPGSTGAATPTAETTETPAPAAPKPMPKGMKRVVKAVQWRYRRLRRFIKQKTPASLRNSTPMKLITGRRSRSLGKLYWSQLGKRRDAKIVVDQADVVIALDAGTIWAGWKLGQRRAERPVVLGLPAARRELDRLGAGNG